MFRTAIKNGKLYIYSSAEMWDKPVLLTSYWLTNAPAYPELDNLIVYEMGQAKYIKAFDKNIPVNPVSDYPELSESIPIPKPRGKYAWKEGKWVKAYG